MSIYILYVYLDENDWYVYERLNRKRKEKGDVVGKYTLPYNGMWTRWDTLLVLDDTKLQKTKENNTTKMKQITYRVCVREKANATQRRKMEKVYGYIFVH